MQDGSERNDLVKVRKFESHTSFPVQMTATLAARTASISLS
jgi:hypothetical protein